MKFDPPLPPKTRKLGLLVGDQWQNFNRHNSGMVSQIHLELGAGIDHPSGIA